MRVRRWCRFAHGWTALVAVAVVTTLVAGPGASTATAEKTYPTEFSSEALIGPGSINATSQARVGLTVSGPEQVSTGEEVTFKNASVSVSLPGEFVASLAGAGVAEIRGNLTCVLLAAGNMQPSLVNIAKQGAFLTSGLPFNAAVHLEGPTERDRPVRFDAPTSGSASFVETVTGHSGELATLATPFEFIIAPEFPPSGCRRPGPLEEDTTRVAIGGEISAYNAAGTRVLGPIGLEVRTVHETFAKIPIGGAVSEKLAFPNWTLSGSLTDKRLGQMVALPAGSTFNGSGELNTETGVGSVSGKLSVPAFTTWFKLFGVLPVGLGMSVSEVGTLAGTIAKSEPVPGDLVLSAPVAVDLGISSVHVLGLVIPTSCSTTEAIGLGLSTTLTHEELVSKGWGFSGATTVPPFQCEGGLLGSLFGRVLSALVSGPENQYAIQVSAPGG